jgi:dihydrodipicolinate synthase/N-acetylneuraminate lyase
MKHLGWLNGDIRLPLTPMSENNFERMKKILEAYEGLPRNK